MNLYEIEYAYVRGTISGVTDEGLGVSRPRTYSNRGNDPPELKRFFPKLYKNV